MGNMHLAVLSNQDCLLLLLSMKRRVDSIYSKQFTLVYAFLVKCDSLLDDLNF